MADYFGCATNFTDTQDDILGYVNLFSALVGFCGSGFVLQHYLFHNSVADTFIFSHLIFFLSLSDFGSSGTFAASQLWLLVDKGSYYFSACVTLRSFIQFFFIASLLWTDVIATYLFRTIVLYKDFFISEKMFRKEGQFKMKKFTMIFVIASHAICWIPSLGVALLLAFLKEYTQTEIGWCSVSSTFDGIFWEAPIVATFVFALVAYIVISITMKQRRKTTDHITTKVQMKLMLFLLAYFACLWPDVASHIVRWATLVFRTRTCRLFWLYFLQNLFVPLQGFLNMIVYTLANHKVRSHYSGLMIVVMFLISPLLVVPGIFYSVYRAIKAYSATPSRKDYRKERTIYLSSVVNESDADLLQSMHGYADWGDDDRPYDLLND